VHLLCTKSPIGQRSSRVCPSCEKASVRVSSSYYFLSVSFLVRPTVALSRRSVAWTLPFSANGVTRVAVGFSDLFYVLYIMLLIKLTFCRIDAFLEG